MLPDRVSNPGPLTYESGALPIALRGPAPILKGLLCPLDIQSTLVISKSKGPSETLRDIRAELRKIPTEQPNFTNEHVICLLLLEIYVEILWTGGEIAPQELFLHLSTIFCYMVLDFYVKTRIRFSFRDKQLFEITEVEITGYDCTSIVFRHIYKKERFMWLSVCLPG